MKRFRTILSLLVALTLCLTAAGSALAEDAAKAGYQMGDVIDDFTLTTPEGDSYTLSALLEKYKAVVLNFWFAGCGPCAMEFPYLEEAYQDFKDDLIVLAITPYDENEDITAYKAEKGLTFPMMKDTLGITDAFVQEGFPTTIMVDRKGVYCFYECGSMPDKDSFVRLFTPFVADDYSESLVGFEIPAPTPTATMPDPAEMAAALNAEGCELAYAADEDEFAWPFLIGSDDSRTYAYASNTGVNETTAIVHTKVTAAAGDVLTFDYKTSTETACDCLELRVNGEVKKVFSGDADWTTYAYAFEDEGEYTVSFAYSKDMMDGAGDDVVYLDNVAVVSGDAAAAALAAVPTQVASLEGTEVSLTINNENAKEITITDPSGMLAMYYGDDMRYFIVPDETADVKVLIGEGIDADACTLYNNFDGVTHALVSGETDEEGYLFKGMGIDSVETTGYSCSTVIMYPFYRDYERMNGVTMFTSEENVNQFCQVEMVSEDGKPIEGVTWSYVDGTAPSNDALPAAGSNTAMTVDYTLTFVDADGAPVTGVIANICDDATCTPMVADDKGVIAFSYPPFEYDIHVLKVPDGYACDPEEGFKTSLEGGDLTITIKKAE